MSRNIANRKSGIYKIINLQNNKVYIGSAIDIERRFAEHFYKLRCGKHQSSHLQAAWEKYGPSCFDYLIIEEVASDQLLVREQYYLDLFKSYEREFGYNTCNVAGNTLGYRHSLETIEAMSEIAKQRTHTEETKQKISEAHSGEKNYFYGKHHTEETKQKLREAAKKRCNFTRKLNWEKVDKIRELYATKQYTWMQLGKLFDVSDTVIGRIVNNEGWTEELRQREVASLNCCMCGTKFITYRDLIFHLRKIHDITERLYAIKYLCPNDDHLCQVCKKPTRYSNFHFQKFCKDHK